jgi:phosphate transport system protein
MSKLLQNEISKLEKKMLTLSALAEENVHKAIKAVDARDIALAQETIESDVEVDRLEVELEEDCLKTLALYQPVASDLRFIVAILKINNDLERVGDFATSIARRAIALADLPRVELPFDLHSMGEKAWSMISRALDALVSVNTALAQQVRIDDKEVDQMHHDNVAKLQEALQNNARYIDCYTALFLVSRSLERIGDHATNIAEDVIYLFEGEIVRHGNKEAPKKASAES